MFQVIYNPFPELAQISEARPQKELMNIVACLIVLPEEKERMYLVLLEEIPKFVQEDLRRQSFYFHHRAYADEPSGAFSHQLAGEMHVHPDNIPLLKDRMNFVIVDYHKGILTILV